MTGRAVYREMVERSKEVVNLTDGDKLQSTEPNSQAMTMHYSFDFAQQVHYLSDPLQPGSIYFLCPSICGIFGVCCEALPRQVNSVSRQYDDNETQGQSDLSSRQVKHVKLFCANVGFLWLCP